MKIVKIISRVFLFVLLVGCIVVELYLHGAFQFWDKLDTVTSMNELTDYINEQLEEEQEEFEVYTKNLSEDEIKSCNRKMDGFLGSVATYVILGEKKDGMRKVRITLQFSDNLYVWNHLNNNKSMEHATAKAQTLYDKMEEIKSSIITADMSDFKKEKVIHDYIIKNCAYGEISGEDKEESYKAYGVLVLGQGVCNGYAEAMHLLLNACGVKDQMVIGTADNEDHAWNMVCLDGAWYQVDVTWDDPTPDQKGYVQYNYFNLTDAIMGESHVWNQEEYDTCSSDQYNYFTYYDRMCEDYTAFQNKVEQLIKKKKKNISLLLSNYDESTYNMSFILDNHTNVSKASYSVAKSDMGTIVTISVKY